MQIGMLETAGAGWRMLDEYVEGVRRVNARQVRDFAQRYLIENNLTVAVLDPQPAKQRAPRAVPGGNSNVH
jgi:zinc protease